MVDILQTANQDFGKDLYLQLFIQLGLFFLQVIIIIINNQMLFTSSI